MDMASKGKSTLKNNYFNNIIKIITNRNIRLLIFVAFLILILIRPVQTVILNSDHLLAPGYQKNFKEYEKTYYSSQYVAKKNPIIIGDEFFRAFAGGVYLKGINPILINHDHPPLGNYIIALSILLFDNAATLIIPLQMATMLGLFLLAKQVTKNSFISLIPLGIFINEPIFLNKFIYSPLIEPIQFPFIVFTFYFFIRALIEEKYLRWFILTSLFLGICISTRFFVTGGIIVFCLTLYLFYKERRISKKFISFLFTLPISLVVLVLSYTRTMMDGYSVIQIFGIQKYILAYHKSKFILPLTFWDLLLFNRWHTWWGEWRISSDPQWLLTWPISVILSVANVLHSIIKKVKLNDAEKLLTLWLMVYTLTLSTGYSSTNYFLPIIPFFYILSTSFLYKSYKYIANRVINKPQ